MAIYDVNGIADHMAADEKVKFELQMRAMGLSPNDASKVSANVSEGATTTIHSVKWWRRLYLDLVFHGDDPLQLPMNALAAHHRLLNQVRDSSPQAH